VLWLRYGVRPPTSAELETVLRSLIPIEALRGRHQPRISVARRLCGHDVVTIAPGHLVVAQRLVRQVERGLVTYDQVCAEALQAFGMLPVHGSRLVRAVELYVTPWRLVRSVLGLIASQAPRIGTLSLLWRLRPIVFGLGFLDAALRADWVALGSAGALCVLTYSTPRLDAGWSRTQQGMAAWWAGGPMVGRPGLARAHRS
jgi:hypothetical protein